MGITVSCPFSSDSDLESSIDSESSMDVVVKSISFGGGNGEKTPMRSISFKGLDSDPTILKSLGSGKTLIEGSVSFKRSDSGTVISITPPSPMVKLNEKLSNLIDEETLDPSSPKHEAATKLQKVYKSFRTRRKLADCAVLVEQSWWKVLDFAELKRSSVSFFDIEKHETAIQRWSRARTRAAKVGKGLLKNSRAQKLALQHWLEAIDPRHRYGHNLHFYYEDWLKCQSREPFFYWLDIGEGKEVNLAKCSRSKLQQQCIKYLGPMERKDYEVAVVDGKFLYRKTGELLNTEGESEDTKWIFVLSTSKTLYVGKKIKGTFQHSSFLAGAATSAAGRLVVDNGTLKAVWPHSGHYRPTEENFEDFVSFLEENNVDISDVKMSPVDDDDGGLNRKRSSIHVRNLSTDANDLHFTENTQKEKKENDHFAAAAASSAAEIKPQRLQHLRPNLTKLEISANREELLKDLATEAPSKQPVLKPFKLGRQLSCNWTTGAGPRIGFVRNHPVELQSRALEHVNLSPRSLENTRSYFAPRTPSALGQ